MQAGNQAMHVPKVHARAPSISRRVRSPTAMKLLASASSATRTLALEVESVRNDMLDASGTVQLNNAGDSPMPRVVLERITKHLEAEATVGGYEAAARCEQELEQVYESAAELINAHPDEIALQVRRFVM